MKSVNDGSSGTELSVVPSIGGGDIKLRKSNFMHLMIAEMDRKIKNDKRPGSPLDENRPAKIRPNQRCCHSADTMN